MKFLTYNLWNHNENFNVRLELACKIIKDSLIDIVALQEVRNEEVVNYFKTQCTYEYVYWKKYDDCDEGLAILSRYPIIKKETNWDSDMEIHNCGIMRTLINVKGTVIGFTNLHLDYKSALNREIETVKLIKKIEEESGEYEILLGDFNSYPNSSIYRYLTGQQSLENHATSWIDLSESYAFRSKNKMEITIDFVNNPRWDNNEVLDVPGRYDWILLKNPYPQKYPKLNHIGIIGNKKERGITASDHYGVICDMDFND